MTKRRVTLTLNWFLLLALVLASCTGLPVPIISSTATPAIPTPTSFQQLLPPALVETDPPLGSVIGHQSPITFYFNQPVNKSSAESALAGLPSGTFTWNDDATLVFSPTQSYQPDTTLNFSIANSIQSANGF
ncbi:MAG TPA: Ig-like domain-containing protein, partial [Anaerolineales bacterium]|nr:Ig-like domain-containing protein [Anaerolineales bacterium]